MAYVPNPADVTQPTDAVSAETAQAEFRALKQALLNLTVGTGGRLARRQAVLSGPVDTNGFATPIAISGTALGVDLKAGNSQGLIMSWANGFNAQGANETVQVFSNDILNFWANLPINNTSYLAADFVSLNPATNPTPVNTFAPPQYGRVYDSTQQGVLHFDSGNGSTTFIDDFGNTWTAHGGAKCQTGTVKFGTSALGGAGGSGQLNGAADYIQCPAITTMPPLGWAWRCWINPTTLPAAINTQQAYIANTTNPGGWGTELGISENGAGAIKFYFAISSNNSSYDIANLIQGTTTPVVGTWYFVELTYDVLAGVYRLYVNGTQEASVASTLRATQGSGICLGSRAGISAFANGFIDEFEQLNYCQHPNGTAYAVPTGAPSITAAGYASDWFDTDNYVMNQVSGASVVAGTNPAFTQKNRLYIGEADTSGAAVTAVRGYAYAGKFQGKFLNNALNTSINLNHNMGVPREFCLTRILGRPFGAVQRQFTLWTEIATWNGTIDFPIINNFNNSIPNDRNVLRVFANTNGIFVDGTSVATAFDILLSVERMF